MNSNPNDSLPASARRMRDDVGNIVALEHVNLIQPDQRLATLFYVQGLLGTRDPYLMVGLDNMWVNWGRTQLHLPSRGAQAQRLRGCIGLVVSDLDLLAASLRAVQPALAGTAFSFARAGDAIEAVCPWGNRVRCHAPDAARFGPRELGIAYLELDAPPGTAEHIGRFYATVLGAPVTALAGGGRPAVRVAAGARQALVFRESDAPLPPFDGHHIQITLADFSSPHRRLQERGLLTRDTDAHEWRFTDIVDADSGAVLLQLEHEVRSMCHPLFGRPLVNRNPRQSNAAYRPGGDAFGGIV